MNIIVHHGIADLYKTLGLPIEENIDFTILSIPEIHGEMPFESPILRADYYSFILTKDGSGVYFLDDNRFPFGPGSFYFTNPGHTKSYELHRSGEAYIITLTENFLREYVHPDIYIEFPFLLAEIVPPTPLSINELVEFEILYTQMFDHFNKQSLYKNQILGNLFHVLLLKIKEGAWLDYNPITEGSRNSEIVKTFKQCLEKEFKAMVNGTGSAKRPQAQDLAEALHLHPNYLNSVIRSKTGKTVNEWITHRTLTSAKSLLRTTTLSSKEIAFKLGFSEPTHFNRFFRKHLDTTPTKFRKSLNSGK